GTTTAEGRAAEAPAQGCLARAGAAEAEPLYRCTGTRAGRNPAAEIGDGTGARADTERERPRPGRDSAGRPACAGSGDADRPIPQPAHHRRRALQALPRSRA